MSKKLYHYLLLSSIFLLILGCGGGGVGGSSVGATSIESDRTVGYFIDSAVEGLDYNCSSGLYGVTDKDGKFICKKDDNVTFSIGDIVFGTVLAKDGNITPFDMFKDDQKAAINLARLLQTFDSDNNASNSITLNRTSFSNIFTEQIEIKNKNFDNKISMLLLREGISLVPRIEAIKHIQDSLNLSDNNISKMLDSKLITLPTFSFPTFETYITDGLEYKVINTTQINSVNINDNSFIEVGKHKFFTESYDSIYLEERYKKLWLLEDNGSITLMRNDKEMKNFVAIGDLLFFVGYDESEADNILYVSDGTVEGTKPYLVDEKAVHLDSFHRFGNKIVYKRTLANKCNIPSNSNSTSICNIDYKIFQIAILDLKTSQIETILEEKVYFNSYTYSYLDHLPTKYITVKNKLFFIHNNNELWISDGTAENTKFVKKFIFDEGWEISFLKSIDNLLYININEKNNSFLIISGSATQRNNGRFLAYDTDSNQSFELSQHLAKDYLNLNGIFLYTDFYNNGIYSVISENGNITKKLVENSENYELNLIDCDGRVFAKNSQNIFYIDSISGNFILKEVTFPENFENIDIKNFYSGANGYLYLEIEYEDSYSNNEYLALVRTTGKDTTIIRKTEKAGLGYHVIPINPINLGI